jgi:acetyl-CoA synthetase
MQKFKPASYEDFVQQFRVDVPSRYNFAYDLVDKTADEEPGRPAILHVDPSGQAREYTYGWLKERSARLAGALTARGVAKGDKVMLMLFRRVEYWVAMIALHKIGALPIPSPALLTPKDITERANYASIKAVVCEDTVVEKFEAARPGCPTMKLFVQVDGESAPEGWERFEAICDEAAPEFPRTEATPGGKDPMVIFFTSGTTGMPKMVVHSYNYPLGHWTTAAYWHDLNPGDVHLTLSDTGWAKSVWGKFYGQFMAGAVVFVWDFRGKFEPAELLGIIADHGITTFCAPPTVYRFLIREDVDKYDLSKLRHCTTAGELLNESVFTTWKERTGLSIYEGYGQTETCLQVLNIPSMTPKPGSIGRPAPGWDIVLLDETGEPVPMGEEGEICIRMRGGDPTTVLGLFDGYMDEPEKTASVMYDGLYHTGDKAWQDEDGYLWFMGRTDDLIKASGYRIGPFEVESALVSHDAVIEAAVTGVPDPVRGQVVKATVVLAPGYEGTDELVKELQNHVKKVTAPYKYPRIMEFTKELPKTISGKIKRGEIREADMKKYAEQG